MLFLNDFSMKLRFNFFSIEKRGGSLNFIFIMQKDTINSNVFEE
jgi:hypothetical protein